MDYQATESKTTIAITVVVVEDIEIRIDFSTTGIVTIINGILGGNK